MNIKNIKEIVIRKKDYGTHLITYITATARDTGETQQIKEIEDEEGNTTPIRIGD